MAQRRHQRAVAAAQRAQVQQMATAMQQAANRLVLDIAHEDADVIVVNKPAGLVVHPAAGNWSGTLLNGLLRALTEREATKSEAHALVSGASDRQVEQLCGVRMAEVRKAADLLAAAQGLTVAESGVGVHAALSIVNDAVRLRRGTSRPEFGAQMAHLMKGVLGACVATVEP